MAEKYQMAEIHQKYEFPQSLCDGIETCLALTGYSYTRPEALAKAVMQLSTYYVQFPKKVTPWSEPWCQAAYLSYYLPLNWWRVTHAVSRGLERSFFDGLDSLVDFGSGLGSAGFALSHQGVSFPAGSLCVEKSEVAIGLHRRLQGIESKKIHWQSSGSLTGAIKKSTLALFSYSLTELSELPSWVSQCEGLMIVEPATQDDGRRLLEIRHKLIDQGWFIAAPCTHQKACPLLTHSERDWCHDRCNWNPPEWILAIERYMPIRNGTLPYSYLMARKSVGSLSLPNAARITGDLQEFKGFAKQLVCRGEDREFIAWQRRNFKKEYPGILRGDLIQVDPDVKKKGNELRPELHQLVVGKGL